MAVSRDYFTRIYGERPQNSNAGRSVHRVCSVIDDLDKRKPNLDEIRGLFARFKKRRDNANSQDAFSEYSLLCGHLSWLGTLHGDNDLTKDYRTFGSSVSNEGLVHRFGESPAENTGLVFLLPNHERNLNEKNGEASEFRRDIFETRSREQFFPRILSVIDRVWPNADLGISPRTLDAHLMMRNSFIQFMHKQLLQNALTHAHANGTFNKNYNSFTRTHFAHEGDDFLFGALAYLEVRLLSPERLNVAEFTDNLASFHPIFFDRGREIYTKLKNRKMRLCTFSYNDSGPGIERHLRNFSPHRAQLPDDFDAKYVLDNKLSGRASINSGEGLNDVRALAKQANASLTIETPNSIYLNDAVAGVEVSSKSTRLLRGTTVSIMFEV